MMMVIVFDDDTKDTHACVDLGVRVRQKDDY